jgi:hypothetical protein
MTFFRRLLVTVCTLVLLAFQVAPSLGTTQSVFAATEITENTTVTATVVVSAPPSVPILVSPGNNSYVTVSKPSFTWKASTDDGAIASYELSIDGSPLFTGIPTSATDNAFYTLTYNNSTDEYTLTPKNDLSQGTHTWKIRAVDNQNLGTDSATWTFTIDTQAPSFVITQIGTTSVSISAQDSGTIPTEPVVVDENPVTISGTGEAGSTVQITLVIPGDPTQNFNIQINPDGTWSQNLGTLPRNITMLLSFTITDPAGNVSILNDIPFTIPSDIIVFPPTPIPTAEPSPTPEPTTTPTPEPGATPEPTPEPSSSPEPTPTPIPAPSIAIPLIPPGELLQEFGQEIREAFLPFFQNLTQALPEAVVKTVEDVAEAVAPVSGLVITTAIPITSTIAVASQFGGGISPDLIIRILQALGLIPVGKPRGMTFNSSTYEPIAFALLTIRSTDTNEVLTETVVSNFDGLYSELKLPPGEYTINVAHQEFSFPTKRQRPAYLSIYDYYKGEKFKIEKDTDKPYFFIPMDKKVEMPGWLSKTRLQIFFGQLTRKLSWFVWPLFFVSGLLAIIIPSIWNTIVFITYGFVVSYKALAWFRTPLVVGRVIDEAGQPIQKAFVRLSTEAQNELVAVVSSDKEGYFRFFGNRDIYSLSVVKEGYVWVQQDSTMSFTVIDTRAGAEGVVVTMKPIQAITEAELFG